ncbi:MAG: DJ-1/PfpI family protein [gamma proteobacterium symbiont of Taylorina sp.]|nr:DJ-1/PfpI family protein [gamma proteobacterium symbiont of Taylorina sp.]
MASVIIPIATGCEELEAVTIIDLLRRADIDVTTVSLDTGSQVDPVTASRGVVLIPDMTLDDAIQKNYDMLVLPGGLPGADYLDKDQRIHNLLKKMAAENKYTAAICAAPKILAHANLLEGKAATSYPGFLDKMELATTQIKNDAVVCDGKIITSRGPATAMEFALILIETLAGKEKRKEVAAGLLWKAE